MMLALALIATSVAAAPPKLAATDFHTVGGVDKALSTFLSEHFAQRLGEALGAPVTTPKTIATVLGMERQKQMLGCADNSTSCVAELAGALGVDAIATGELAKLERSYQINVRILDAKDGRPVFTGSRRAANTEGLVDELTNLAQLAARTLTGAQEMPATVQLPAPAAPTPPTAKPWLVPTIVGAVLAAAGGASVVLGQLELAKIPSMPTAAFAPETARQTAQRAGLFNQLGWVGVGVGLGSVAAGIVWAVLSQGRSAVSLVPSANGLGFAMGLP